MREISWPELAAARKFRDGWHIFSEIMHCILL